MGSSPAWERSSSWRRAMHFASLIRHKMPMDFFDYLNTGRMSPDLLVAARMDEEFPLDPHTRQGQRLMWRTFDRYDTYYASIPRQCYAMLQIVTQKFTHRRKDTLRNILYVSEAIVHRAAYENERRVLFSYESLRLWVLNAKNYDIAPLTIQNALKYINGTEFFSVYLGQKGDLNSCTAIRLHLSHLDLADEQETHDWLADVDWVMTKVYGREVDAHDRNMLRLRQATSLQHDTRGNHRTGNRTNHAQS